MLEEEDLDPPPSKTSIERTIEILLKTSKKDEWEGYISTKEPRKALLLRFVCSKCGTPWNIERKECYFWVEISFYQEKGTGEILSPGMTIAIEPMVNAGGWEVETLDNGWTVVTRDRSLSAQFEHTVYIDKSGAVVLTE